MDHLEKSMEHGVGPTCVPAELLRELASSRFTELAPHSRMRKGQRIGTQGGPCHRIHLIAAGQVLVSRRDSEGQQHALYLLGPGEVFGVGALLPPRRWLVTARAVTEGSFYALPGAHVATLAQYYPQLAACLFSLLAARLEQAHRRLDIMVRRSARDRLLGLLSTLACYHGEGRGDELWLPVQVSQSQLGSMIGLARETVARTLTELETDGLIRREGRSGYWLLRSACEGQQDQLRP